MFGVEVVRRLHTLGAVTGDDVEGFALALTNGSAPQVLDVRSVELRQADPVWVVCASGFRASIAAELLERHGFRPGVLSDGGGADVSDRVSAVAAT